MKILKHLARVISGFFAATFAALIVMMVLHPLVTGSSAYSSYFSFSFREFILVASVDWVFLAMSAVIPALIVIVVAEAIKLRSILVYGAIGVLFGFLFTGHARFIPWIDLSGGGAPQSLSESFVMIVAGLFAGLAYWRYAGKYAGRWREA